MRKTGMRTAFALTAAIAAAACGGGGNHVENPMPIPGGGVGQGAIDGELNVFVVDGVTEQPVAGAAVRVGASSDAQPLTGTTDLSGLVTFEDDLHGPQTITVTAEGYAAETWIGANGAVVTIPLAKPRAAGVAMARVEGGIGGWDALPAPAQGHYTLAVIGYSQSTAATREENELAQPTVNLPGGVTIPANLCFRNAFLNQCAWRLNVRTGKVRVYAMIVDGTQQGSAPNPLTDPMTLIGYAISESMTLNEGQTITGKMLPMVPAADLVDFEVAFQAAPAGLPTVQGAPVLDLGDDGTLPLFVPSLTPDRTSTKVPALTGDRASGRYQAFGRAVPDAMDDVPGTNVFARDVTVGGPIPLGAWLATPSDITASGGTYSFTRAPGATLHVAQFGAADVTRAWTVAILDASSSFSLPTLSPDPLPAGQVELRVAAFDVPGANLGDFRIDDLMDRVARVSVNAATFSH